MKQIILNQGKLNLDKLILSSVKKNIEKEKPVMIQDINNKKKEVEKLKSPTTIGSKPKTTQIQHNKHDDEKIQNNQNYNNPFVKQNSRDQRDLKENKDKEMPRQVKMNSSSKKNRVENSKSKK